MAMVDLRRTDLRKQVLANPYWITSAVLTNTVLNGNTGMCFVFDYADRRTLVLGVAFQVITAFDSSTTIDVGRGTIATTAVTSGGTLTNVDVDEFMKQDDITSTTIGMYFGDTAHKSDWLTAMQGWQFLTGSGSVIVGAASTVPVVYVTIAAGTPTKGTGRVHMLICDLPGT